MGNPKFTLSQISNFGKLDCPARQRLHTVAARLTNPSFTSSHDRVVFPTWAHLVVTKSPHTGASAQGTPPFIISTLHQVTMHTCTPGGRSPKSPRPPRQVIAQTRRHTPVHALIVRRVPHTRACPLLNHRATLLAPSPTTELNTSSSCSLAQGWAYLNLRLLLLRTAHYRPAPAPLHE